MKYRGRHDENHTPKSKTLPSRKDIGEPVFTATKQIARYTTVQGIQADISYLENEWPEVMLKDLLTNAWDFESDFYPSPLEGDKHTKDDRWITVSIKIVKVPERENMGLFRINIRNSNVAHVKVFKDLKLIFNYELWGSTKRGQHRGTGGALGDYLKRALGMAYATWSENSDDRYSHRFS